MPYATNQGLRIHYRVEGAGPPLVLQHGYTWNMGGWSRSGYVEPLKSHYQLILLDARGHGASDKPHDPDAYRLPRKVGDVVAVLDALEVPSAHFWGTRWEGGSGGAWRNMRQNGSGDSSSAVRIRMSGSLLRRAASMAPIPGRSSSLSRGGWDSNSRRFPRRSKRSFSITIFLPSRQINWTDPLWTTSCRP